MHAADNASALTHGEIHAAAPAPEAPAPAAPAAPAPAPAALTEIKPAEQAAEIALLPPEPPAVEPDPVTRTVTLKRGDTLGKVLDRAGVSGRDAHMTATALRKVFNPRDLKAGQNVMLTFIPAAHAADAADAADADSPGLFHELVLKPDIRTVVRVSRSDGDAFGAEKQEKELTSVWRAAEGVIQRSLYLDGLDAGVPLPVLGELIRAYSWDVDFQRSIQRGDRFEVMYEEVTDEDGAVLKTGVVAHAVLHLGKETLKIYRHVTADGKADYFNEKGAGAKKGLMRTPIDGARLSSGYGKRKHPILGYTKMHRGVDFAAPRGTPIYAAGDGRVEYAGRKGAYGKYIRIRHNGQYATAYGHLSRIQVKSGQYVRQGAVIGRVGTTGRSTGPHLHYEIMVDGRQQNPMRVKMPSGVKLTGGEMKRFQATARAADKSYARLRKAGDVLASAD
ncbi:MAG: peptidoglycan DD-metalloendopeptidase family protein [Rhodospirillales bacterium]